MYSQIILEKVIKMADEGKTPRQIITALSLQYQNGTSTDIRTIKRWLRGK